LSKFSAMEALMDFEERSMLVPTMPGQSLRLEHSERVRLNNGRRGRYVAFYLRNQTEVQDVLAHLASAVLKTSKLCEQ